MNTFIKKNKRLVIGIGVLILAFLSVFIVMLLTNKPSHAKSMVSTKIDPMVITHIPDIQLALSEALLEGCTAEELAEQSTCIVYGRVSNISDPFKIRRLAGGVRHAMDVTSPQ